MDIYLDHAATTRVRDEVVQAMLPYLQDEYGNPSSYYDLGIRNQKTINEARRNIARLLHAPTPTFYFTSSGTEANNWALKGLAFKYPHKKEIITTSIEHHSILNSCEFLERFGYRIHYLTVDEEGFVSADELEALINDQTLVVSVHYANNEIGTIQNVAAIGEVCKRKGVFFHCDAVQAAGYLPIDFSNIDLLTLSAHKFYGPKGIGALYIRERIDIEPLIHGGRQEKNVRAGTENVAAIVGFVKALELAIGERQEYADIQQRTRQLYEGLHAQLGEDIRLNGPAIGPKRLPNNLNVSFKGIDGMDLSYRLGKQGIYVSTGSACDSDRIEPSHVIKGINVPEPFRNGTIRMTLGRETTTEIINEAIQRILSVIREYK